MLLAVAFAISSVATAGTTTKEPQANFTKEIKELLKKPSFKIEDEIEASVTFTLNNEGEILIGKPYLESVKIKGKILEHLRGKKTLVYKMRPKKKTRKKQGHRQELTRVFIEDIIVN